MDRIVQILAQKFSGVAK